MKLLTQEEVDAAMVGHDPDKPIDIIDGDESRIIRVSGENGLVTLAMSDEWDGVHHNLTEAECRRLAAVLVRLADIWCVS